MQFMDSGASGTRHALWVLKILANGSAHLELNEDLTPQQRKALTSELALVQQKSTAVAEANAKYRRFLDTGLLLVGAKQRVANYLCDVALEDGRGQLSAKRRDAESVVPGILSRFTEGFSLSRALAAGHARTVEIARRAADVVSLLPDDRFAFAAAVESALRAAATRLEAFNAERQRLDDDERAPLRLAVERAILDLRETLAQVNGRLRTHFSARFIDSLYPDLDPKGRQLADDDAADDDDAPTPPAA